MIGAQCQLGLEGQTRWLKGPVKGPEPVASGRGQNQYELFHGEVKYLFSLRVGTHSRK